MKPMAKPEWAQNLPDWSNLLFLGVPGWKWIGIIAALLLMRLTYSVTKEVVKRVIARRDATSPAPLSDFSNKAIRRSLGIIAASVVGMLCIPELMLTKRLEHYAEGFVRCIALAGGIFLLLSLWDAVCDTIQERTAGKNERAERLLVPVTRKLIRITILITGLLAALGLFGVNIAGLLAGLGIGGLVVALAAKDSVENIFGSLTILFDMPFALGDWVKIDKIEGVVEEINLRSTKIRTFDDSLITVPNSNLIKASVENFGARRVRRQKIVVKVAHGHSPEDLDGFSEDLKQYIDGHPEFEAGRSTVAANEYEETFVGILVLCYILADHAADENAIKHQLLLEIERLRTKYRLDQPPIR